ncbi:MAG: Nramp family divalent metal transporter [Chthonomonadales bacterium]
MSVHEGATPEQHSLPESYRSVKLPTNASRFRKFFTFAGPAYLVSVGYMDPGNWATDLEGGSRFGYRLLWVVLLSNLMAILLQILCARLGLVTGKDLAQACKSYCKKPAATALWIICELAIIACDLAEVIGSAIALNLLFGLPLFWGVIITGFDVLLLIALTHFGFRKLEAVILALVGAVAACFALEVIRAHPVWGSVAGGMFVPHKLVGEQLYVALGILGATVMPHNLYLHSSIVQTRAVHRTPKGLKQAIKYNTLDTVIALMLAFFVNASILILAAAVFHTSGKTVTDLSEAHTLLRPLLGGAAATAFAIALLASGQSSTITGTLAGQIVMEGFMEWKINPVVRRLITRSLAIVPAAAIILIRNGSGLEDLLIFSQVALSMQLGFAVFPLLFFTSDKKLMGKFVNPLIVKILGYGTGIAIAALNTKLLIDHIGYYWLSGIVIAATLFSCWVKWGWKEPAKQANNPPTLEATP